MSSEFEADSIVLHASAVVVNGRAALITGDAGTGKSALALALLALGCGLIADDRSEVFLRNGGLWTRAPATLPPMIEARGVGLLSVTLAPAAPVIVIVNLNAVPRERLPTPQKHHILGCDIPLLAGKVGSHLAPALFLILKTGQVPHHG